MKEKITMTRTEYELKEGTKGAYKEVSSNTREIDRQFYNNYVNASPFFRRLGGSEYVEREYTCRGYNVTKIISKSPDRKKKNIAVFKFE